MKDNTSNYGFSMLEIAVVLIIASVVLVALLPVLLDIKEEEGTRITMKRLAKIEAALQHFADTEGRLPCPADITLPPEDPDFAKEGGADDVTDGNCSSAAPSATWTSAGGVVAGGMVPTRALHLPDEYAFDGEGVRFAYHVSENLTAERGVAAFSCSGGITVQDQQGNNRTTNAAYVLLSHGQNTYGSYGPSGTQRATESTNDGEKDNYGDGGYDATFRQSAGYMQNTADPLSQFDDIALYKERYQLFEPFRFDQVMSTHWHACGLSNYGRAYCWGNTASGRLGIGPTMDSQKSAPQVVYHPYGERFDKISVGDHHTCALDEADSIYCWGNNSSYGTGGQLGDGTTTNRDEPNLVEVDVALFPLGLLFTDVSAGGSHTCALAMDNEIYCWGDATYGKLGIGSVAPVYRPETPVTKPAGVTGWSAVDAGTHHTCAIGDDGLSYCWGRGTLGRLGYASGGTADQDIPTLVDFAAGITTNYISAGGSTTCAIGSNHFSYCWGGGTSGQIGDGGLADRSVPTQVSSSVLFTSIESGRYGTCAVGVNDLAYCWGKGDAGELGNGTNTAVQGTPIQVNAPPSYFHKLYNGNKNACGFNDNWGYCWGSDEYGKIGDGGGINMDMNVPAPLANPNDPCPL